MSDEQSSIPSNQESAQSADEPAAMTQPQLSELITAAKLGSESVKASESSAQAVLKQLNDILVAAKAASEKIEDATPKFAAAATEVETRRVAVATHAQQIDEAQKRAAEVRGELDGVLASAKQTQAQAENLKQNVESAKASASQIDADILKIKATAEANAMAVATALETSKAASATAKGLADKAKTVEQRIQDYETKLGELNAQCDTQLDDIKHLLPGATAAGLASAFDERRQTFLEPSKRWERVFVWSVVVLAAMALVSLLEVYFNVSKMTYQQLLVLWLSRIPFAAALVWLAMHASRETALGKRLEEDYGFKASVARSFQGFQEQMKNLGDSAQANEPLKTLCDATLAQITNPPGRIYDKHALIVTPTAEFVKAANALAEAVKAAKWPLSN